AKATSDAARVTEGGAKAAGESSATKSLGQKAADFAHDASVYAADLAKEAILAEAIGFVQVAIAHKIDGKPMPKGEELEDMFVQQLVGVIGMRIGNMMLETGVEAYKAIGDHGKIDISGLVKERADINKMATKIANDARKNPYAKPDRAKLE